MTTAFGAYKTRLRMVRRPRGPATGGASSRRSTSGAACRRGPRSPRDEDQTNTRRLKLRRPIHRKAAQNPMSTG